MTNRELKGEKIPPNTNKSNLKNINKSVSLYYLAFFLYCISFCFPSFLTFHSLHLTLPNFTSFIATITMEVQPSVFGVVEIAEINFMLLLLSFNFIFCNMSSENACYHSVQNLLSSTLLSKNIKINVCGSIILPVVLYGCETWSLTLRERRRLRVFEK